MSGRGGYGAIGQDRIDVNEILFNEDSATTQMDTGILKGRVRKLGWASWCFVGLVLCEVLSVVSLTLFRIYTTIPLTSETRSDFVFGLALLINVAFAAYFAFYGVLKERVVELYSYLAASVLVFCYVFYQFFDNQPHTKDWQASKSVRLARLILMAVLEPATLFFAIYVARSFGWVSFVTMGVNSQLQRTYRTYTLHGPAENQLPNPHQHHFHWLFFQGNLACSGVTHRVFGSLPHRHLVCRRTPRFHT